MDYNNIYDSGKLEEGIINVVVEIPEGSCLKVEYNRHLKTFELDRVEPKIFAKPCSYGFIPQTLDEDGDELDALLISPEPVSMGVVVKAKIIGIMNFEDDGEMDHKVICVPADDRHSGNAIKTLKDLSEQYLKQLEHHFTHYKDLKKAGSTKVLGFEEIESAISVIEDCQVRFKQEYK
jgi:inorganic pyrophosphatase